MASNRRRITSPPTKSGPLKATLTFGLKGSPNPASATRSSNGRKSPASSPSPQWSTIAECHRKARRSPDNRLSPDRAASSSPGFRGEIMTRSHLHLRELLVDKQQQKRSMSPRPGSKCGSSHSSLSLIHGHLGCSNSLPSIWEWPSSVIYRFQSHTF